MKGDHHFRQKRRCKQRTILYMGQRFDPIGAAQARFNRTPSQRIAHRLVWDRIAIHPVFKLMAKCFHILFITSYRIRLSQSHPEAVTIQHISPFYIFVRNITPVNFFLKGNRNAAAFHVPRKTEEKCLLDDFIRRLHYKFQLICAIALNIGNELLLLTVPHPPTRRAPAGQIPMQFSQRIA
ncbi:hypothetical protein D3C76_747160 [compost metagenome]